MPHKIHIKAGDIELEGILNDTPTARLIWERLPIESSGNLWGEEIYFSIPINSELDKTARDTVDRGELAYWPIGKAFCIFFGPTPLTEGDEIVSADKVNIVGRIIGDPSKLKEFEDGDFIILSRGGSTQ
ncbi:MAG: cyclophilin-like fold protein [bacterium]